MFTQNFIMLSAAIREEMAVLLTLSGCVNVCVYHIILSEFCGCSVLLGRSSTYCLP